MFTPVVSGRLRGTLPVADLVPARVGLRLTGSLSAKVPARRRRVRLLNAAM